MLLEAVLRRDIVHGAVRERFSRLQDRHDARTVCAVRLSSRLLFGGQQDVPVRVGFCALCRVSRRADFPNVVVPLTCILTPRCRPNLFLLHSCRFFLL